MRSLLRSLFLPAIVLGLLAMAAAYTGQGSRGFKANPNVVAAATLIYTATAAGRTVPSAPAAMKATNLFTEAECANDSKQRNSATSGAQRRR